MLPTAHAYSSFAAKDIAAEREFYAKKLGLDVNELYDGQLLELSMKGQGVVLVELDQELGRESGPRSNHRCGP